MNVSSIFNNSTLNPFNSTLRTSRTKSMYTQMFNQPKYPFFPNMSQSLNFNNLGMVQSAKAAATKLKSSIGNMAKSNLTKEVTSSQTDKVSVKTTNSTFYKELPKTTMRVDQVATGQQNKGTALTSTGSTLAVGAHKFEIETEGGVKHEFIVDITAADNNKSAQQKIADSINKRKIGVTASVAVDTDTSKSALTIQAKDTGDRNSNRFSVRDLTGTAISSTGTSAMTQDAQNAIYRVNNSATRTSASNDIYLGNGVTATLKKTTTEDVVIKTGFSSTNGKNAMSEIVNSINELVSSAGSIQKKSGSNRLQRDLSGILTSYRGSLSTMGISITNEGKLKIDEKRFEAASKDGSMEKFLKNDQSSVAGFTKQLSKLSTNVNTNPTAYINKSNYSVFTIQRNQNNANMIFAFNQNASNGFLFNMFI